MRGLFDGSVSNVAVLATLLLKWALVKMSFHFAAKKSIRSDRIFKKPRISHINLRATVVWTLVIFEHTAAPMLGGLCERHGVFSFWALNVSAFEFQIDKELFCKALHREQFSLGSANTRLF